MTEPPAAEPAQKCGRVWVCKRCGNCQDHCKHRDLSNFWEDLSMPCSIKPVTEPSEPLTGPCSACGDGDKQLRYHSHDDRRPTSKPLTVESCLRELREMFGPIEHLTIEVNDCKCCKSKVAIEATNHTLQIAETLEEAMAQVRRWHKEQSR